MSTGLSINKYLPIALLYFFFNGVFLPHGMLWTTLLTPVFIYWLYGKPSFPALKYFFFLFAPYLVIHMINGVDNFLYLRSFVLLFSVFVFSVAFYEFLSRCHTLRRIYKYIILINVPMILIGLVILFVPKFRETWWYANEITSGINSLRMRMLTYEPSYYSTLLVPIALYYYLKLLVLKLPNPTTLFLLLTIPLILSLSFGVILGLVLALLITLVWGAADFFPNKNVVLYVLLSIFVLIVAMIVVTYVFPNSVFVVRIQNAFSGKDSSFKGRTFDSFHLGWSIASMKSFLFGCGLGQTKILGVDIFNELYNTNTYNITNVGIPNTLGDTLAVFGLVGLVLRFYFIIYFFFRQKVYTNYYRLSLFMYIFIYQFTGSFIMNIAEYVIWVMAFHKNIFPEFDKEHFKPLSGSFEQQQKIPGLI